MKLHRYLVIVLASVSLLSCTTTTLYEVRVSGLVTGEGSGAVEVQLHAGSQGEGELAHPLGELERFEVELGQDWEHTLLYPWDDSTGLVVYAWLDRDADGVLCAPGADPEPSGLVEVADFPAHEVDVELELDASCEGPEGLYP